MIRPKQIKESKLCHPWWSSSFKTISLLFWITNHQSKCWLCTNCAKRIVVVPKDDKETCMSCSGVVHACCSRGEWSYFLLHYDLFEGRGFALLYISMYSLHCRDSINVKWLKKSFRLIYVFDDSTIKKAQMHFKYTSAYTAFFGNEILC